MLKHEDETGDRKETAGLCQIAAFVFSENNCFSCHYIGNAIYTNKNKFEKLRQQLHVCWWCILHPNNDRKVEPAATSQHFLLSKFLLDTLRKMKVESCLCVFFKWEYMKIYFNILRHVLLVVFYCLFSPGPCTSLLVCFSWWLLFFFQMNLIF